MLQENAKNAMDLRKMECFHYLTTKYPTSSNGTANTKLPESYEKMASKKLTIQGKLEIKKKKKKRFPVLFTDEVKNITCISFAEMMRTR